MTLQSSPTNGTIAADSVTGRLYKWDSSLQTWSLYGGVARASVTSTFNPGIPTNPGTGELLYDADTNQLQIFNPLNNFYRLVNSGGQDKWGQTIQNPPPNADYQIPFDVPPASPNIPLLDNDYGTSPGRFLNTASYTRKFHCVLTLSAFSTGDGITEYRSFFAKGGVPNGQNLEGLHVQFDAQQGNGFTVFSTHALLEIPPFGEFRCFAFGGTNPYQIGMGAFGADENHSTKLVITEIN